MKRRADLMALESMDPDLPSSTDSVIIESLLHMVNILTHRLLNCTCGNSVSSASTDGVIPVITDSPPGELPSGPPATPITDAVNEAVRRAQMP